MTCEPILPRLPFARLLCARCICFRPSARESSSPFFNQLHAVARLSKMPNTIDQGASNSILCPECFRAAQNRSVYYMLGTELSTKNRLVLLDQLVVNFSSTL